MGEGCRFKEIFGDSDVEHRVAAFWEHKRHWGEGGVGEVFQWIEDTLWEKTERETSGLGEGSNMQDTRRWTLSGQNKKNGGNSLGKKKC